MLEDAWEAVLDEVLPARGKVREGNKVFRCMGVEEES
jgi:hypothetical protein